MIKNAYRELSLSHLSSFANNTADNDVCCFAEFGEHDIPALCLIENVVNPSPWKAENFLSSLARAHHCVGIKRNNEWLAYAVCSQVLDEAELLIIGVQVNSQGRGLGKALLYFTLDLLHDKTRSLFLEVRESNARAIEFYESMGLNCVGTRPGYYSARGKNQKREDALIFALEIGNWK